MDPIPGHSLYLDPPDVREDHFLECPEHPDFDRDPMLDYSERGCECEDISRDAASDIGDRRNKEAKEG